MMVRKIIEEWKPVANKNIYVLTVDKIIPLITGEIYNNYRIDGKLYRPVSMSPSLTGTKCIAVKGEGGFVGKEVEFVNVTDETNERIAV